LYFSNLRHSTKCTSMRRLRAPLVLGAKCEWSSVASVRRLRRIVVCGVGKRRGALMRIEAQPSLSCASITERSSCPSDWSRANFPETHPHRVGHRPRGPTWLGHPVHMCGVDGMLRQSNSRTQLGQVLQLIGGGRRAVLLSPASSCNPSLCRAWRCSRDAAASMHRAVR